MDKDFDKIKADLINVWIEPNEFNLENHEKLKFHWNVTQFETNYMNI